eukprot:236794-Chlamydomonas_euryale.AAC.3
MEQAFATIVPLPFLHDMHSFSVARANCSAFFLFWLTFTWHKVPSVSQTVTCWAGERAGLTGWCTERSRCVPRRDRQDLHSLHARHMLQRRSLIVAWVQGG